MEDTLWKQEQKRSKEQEDQKHSRKEQQPGKRTEGATTHGKTGETRREVFVMKDTPGTLVDNDEKTSRLTQRDICETSGTSPPPTNQGVTKHQNAFRAQSSSFSSNTSSDTTSLEDSEVEEVTKILKKTNTQTPTPSDVVGMREDRKWKRKSESMPDTASTSSSCNQATMEERDALVATEFNMNAEMMVDGAGMSTKFKFKKKTRRWPGGPFSERDNALPFDTTGMGSEIG